jgi:hypothetical protein
MQHMESHTELETLYKDIKIALSKTTSSQPGNQMDPWTKILTEAMASPPRSMLPIVSAEDCDSVIPPLFIQNKPQTTVHTSEIGLLSQTAASNVSHNK